MHLDEPALFRFLRWIVGLLQGDLGTSYANDMPIADLIAGRFVNTLKLAGVTALFSVPIALTLGITAAMLRGSPLRPDRHGVHDRRHLRAGIHGRDLRRADLRRLSEMAAGALLRQ